LTLYNISSNGCGAAARHPEAVASGIHGAHQSLSKTRSPVWEADERERSLTSSVVACGRRGDLGMKRQDNAPVTAARGVVARSTARSGDASGDHQAAAQSTVGGARRLEAGSAR
jgi:hypothetical protein